MKEEGDFILKFKHKSITSFTVKYCKLDRQHAEVPNNSSSANRVPFKELKDAFQYEGDSA
jgi:hypothetical protein